ncbi:hypothetical protein GH714_040621 [Hevea brasiliensis]|uniref:Cytochrome P450 n=1 Tax=Hevea brasiliensis TaxID=3981 RepID=A0A6A6KXJ8_HEVBR|nr:hypothetical protein GH714_040621 [Hevea brasiliensis]
MGHTKTLVVSSAEAAREMMKAHDIIFSNRPRTTAANIFLYGCLDIGFAPYGEYWRQVKKLGVIELLSLRRVQSFQFVREEEVAILLDKLRGACVAGATVNLSEMLLSVSNNIASRCVIGRRADDEAFGKSKFGELSRRIMVQFTDFSFGDTFPLLGWMDYLTGLIPRLKLSFRETDAFLDQVIEEHRILESDDPHHLAKKDFVDILLSLQKNCTLDFQLTPDKLKAVLMDMFVGGTDATSTTMEWLMAELIKDHKVMRKAQEELSLLSRRVQRQLDEERPFYFENFPEFSRPQIKENFCSSVDTNSSKIGTNANTSSVYVKMDKGWRCGLMQIVKEGLLLDQTQSAAFLSIQFYV